MFFLTLAISLISALPFLRPGYFPMHDDLQVMRMFQLEKCFADGQIPCRWVPDMAFGYGQAMFNFYSATPYYLGIIIRLLTPFSIMDTVKILFAICLVFSGVTMYALAREFFSKKGAMLSAVLYVFAPYKAVDVYVRGALSEAFSLVLLPLLWLTIYKVITKPTFKNVVFLALVLAAQLATHNVSTLMYSAFTAVWTLYWLAQNRKVKNLWATFCAGVLGVGIAGFFIIPVFLEKSLIQDDLFINDYSYYGAHFVSLNQLFISRFWGYGGSIFGDGDLMSFQVGWPHWWAALLAVIVGFTHFRQNKKITILSMGLVSMGFFAAFLAHPRSFPIWEAVSTIAFVQFPWRFLGIVIFMFSFAAGNIALIKKGILANGLIFAIVVATIILNVGYFRPEMHFLEDTDETKLSGEQFLIQQKSAIVDYLPKTASHAPQALAPDKPWVASGIAEIPNFSESSSTFFFDALVTEKATIRIPVIYFPGWKVYRLEGQGINLNARPGDELGIIEIELSPGKHMVHGRFENTPVRAAANAITIISVLTLAAGSILTLNKKKFLWL